MVRGHDGWNDETAVCRNDIGYIGLTRDIAEAMTTPQDACYGATDSGPGIKRNIMLKRALASRLSAPTKLKMRRLASRMLVMPNYIYDARRFLSSSTAAGEANDVEKLSAHITMDYHRIEKGMALPSPRPGFGQDVVARLLAYIPEYERRFGPADVTRVARAVLAEYHAFSAAHDVPLPKLTTFLGTPEPTNLGGGTVTLLAEQLFPFDSNEAQAFVGSRRSVRNFTGQSVPQEMIEEAVRLAQRAPSVCNRQAGRVYACNEPARMAKVLTYQNGNRGFGDTLGAVFVVTADMRAFTTLGERNQAWVDGGIFAMSLAMGLHSLKLGTCMLNWSVDARHDRKARAALGIDEHQAIITMLGAGFPIDTVKVAASPRRELSTVLHWL